MISSVDKKSPVFNELRAAEVCVGELLSVVKGGPAEAVANKAMLHVAKAKKELSK